MCIRDRACESAWIPAPGPRHAELLGGLIRHAWMTSRLVPDAHLAALAIEHGLTLCSTDGDFANFPGLTWKNPLAANRGVLRLAMTATTGSRRSWPVVLAQH